MEMLKDILVKSTRLTEKLVRRMDRDSGGESSGEEEVSLKERVRKRKKGKKWKIRSESGSESEEEVALSERVGKRKRQQEESDEDEVEESEDDLPLDKSVASSPSCRCVEGVLQAKQCLVASCPCSRAGRECGEGCHLGRPWHTVPCLNTESGRRVEQMTTQEMLDILETMGDPPY